MNQGIVILIVLTAGIILAHYLLKWKTIKEEEAKKLVPVDQYGVVIEPNSAQALEVMTDIQGLM